MRLKNRIFETFNDGVLAVAIVSERRIAKIRAEHIRFGDKTVGASRFFAAKTASDQIDRMIAVPPVPGIRATDLILIDSAQYQIIQMQEKFDASPPCIYLSLAESKIRYKEEQP